MHPTYDPFVSKIRQLEKLKTKRNWIVHGAWSDRDHGYENVASRLWNDKRLDVPDLYYCTISKHNRMFHQQPMTIDDVREVARQIRSCVTDLAVAAGNLLRDVLGASGYREGLFDSWMYTDADTTL